MDELPNLEGGAPAAPTLVLLHAASSGPALWQPQVESLADRWHVLAPDLADDLREGAFTVPTAAERVAQLIGRQAGGQAIVCGISLGAFVALQLAIDHPEHVRALILSGGQARPSRLPLALTYLLLHVLPRRTVVRPGGSRRALLATYRSLFDWDVRDRLSDVRAPTLVVCGTRDRANLPAARQLAAEIPGASLEVVDGAGHLWIGGRPRQFEELLETFLAESA